MSILESFMTWLNIRRVKSKFKAFVVTDPKKQTKGVREYCEEVQKNIVRASKNMKWPEDSNKKKVHGEAKVIITLDRNGAMLDLQVIPFPKQSNPEHVDLLSNAAEHTVRLAMPFPPVPEHVLPNEKCVSLLRTFYFVQKRN